MAHPTLYERILAYRQDNPEAPAFTAKNILERGISNVQITSLRSMITRLVKEGQLEIVGTIRNRKGVGRPQFQYEPVVP